MDPSTNDLTDLLEESEDLHADAMRETSEASAELVELHHDEMRTHETEDAQEREEFAVAHRQSLQHSLSGAAVLGAAGGATLLALLASPAAAASSSDVQILQTAASIETLAVSTYGTALTLPYIGGATANPVVKKFCQVTQAQHRQHQAAFNAALAKIGGKKQKHPDPAFVPVVQKAVAGLTGASASVGALGVVGLALELETIAAQTYVNDMGNLKNKNAKKTTASIMGVEAQHAAVLRAVQALLKAGAPQLITLSATNVAALPGVAGSVGFPNAFFLTKTAAPKSQGAVK